MRRRFVSNSSIIVRYEAAKISGSRADFERGFRMKWNRTPFVMLVAMLMGLGGCTSASRTSGEGNVIARLWRHGEDNTEEEERPAPKPLRPDFSLPYTD